MTYGAAVPRIQPRPTLDNLREPQVPISIRSSPSRTVGPNTSNQSNINTNTTPTTSITYDFSNSNTISTINNTNIIPNNLSSNNNIQTLQTGSNYSIYQKSSREPSPLLSPSNSNAYTETANQNQHQFNLESYDRMTDYTIQDRYMRDRSPSIFLEPPSPTEGPPISSRSISPTSQHTTSSPTSPKSPTPSKSKLKPKLTLSLGRLGRSQPDQTESVRLREDLELHVANPTFTRENLRQRNYDAFFESGEPVYSLEPKIASPSPEPETLNSPLTNQLLSGHESTSTTKIRSLGLFGRSKSPVGWRSKSADLESSREAEAYQKGDRCHRQSFLDWIEVN